MTHRIYEVSINHTNQGPHGPESGCTISDEASVVTIPTGAEILGVFTDSDGDPVLTYVARRYTQDEMPTMQTFAIVAFDVTSGDVSGFGKGRFLGHTRYSEDVCGTYWFTTR